MMVVDIGCVNKEVLLMTSHRDNNYKSLSLCVCMYMCTYRKYVCVSMFLCFYVCICVYVYMCVYKCVCIRSANQFFRSVFFSSRFFLRWYLSVVTLILRENSFEWGCVTDLDCIVHGGRSEGAAAVYEDDFVHYCRWYLMS